MSTFHRNSPPSYYLPEVDRTEVKSNDSRRRTSEVNPLPREVSAGDSIVTKQLPYQAAGRAQQTISEKIRADGDISHVKYTHSESPTVTKPLLVECDDCGGANSEPKGPDLIEAGDRELRGQRHRTHSGSKGPDLILIECDDCSGAGLITPDHPNDPWATVWTCSMCDGDGQVIAGCECCREDAVEIWDGEYLCEQHAAEARADAETVA